MAATLRRNTEDQYKLTALMLPRITTVVAVTMNNSQSPTPPKAKARLSTGSPATKEY